jgi:hypothetical protein
MTCEFCCQWTARTRETLNHQIATLKEWPETLPLCPRCRQRDWARSAESLVEEPEARDVDWNVIIAVASLVIGIIAITVTMMILIARAEAAVECRAERGAAGQRWAWRTIDSRRCWYPGQLGMPKSNLHWVTAKPPDAGTVFTFVTPGGPGLNQGELMPDASRPDGVEVGAFPTQATADLGTPLTEGVLLASVCCWPDLAELEAEEIGLRKAPVEIWQRIRAPIREPSRWWMWAIAIPAGYAAFQWFLIGREKAA